MIYLFMYLHNKDDTIEIINDIIDKYEFCKKPIRAVMIRPDYCFMCESPNKNIHFRREDSFSGHYNCYNWISCDKCLSLLDIIEKYYYDSCNFIQYSLAKILEDEDYRFFRVSSNKNLKPYIQENCYFCFNEGNYINKFNNRVTATMSWDSSVFNRLVKTIPLANLIYFNRFKFGYKYEDFPIKNLNNNWKMLIKKEYTKANSFEQFLLIMNRIKKNFPEEILKIIFSYSIDLHIF